MARIEALRLNEQQLAGAVGISPAEANANMDRLLDQHAREWKAYTQALAPHSFINNWIGSPQ